MKGLILPWTAKSSKCWQVELTAKEAVGANKLTQLLITAAYISQNKCILLLMTAESILIHANSKGDIRSHDLPVSIPIPVRRRPTLFKLARGRENKRVEECRDRKDTAYDCACSRAKSRIRDKACFQDLERNSRCYEMREALPLFRVLNLHG